MAKIPISKSYFKSHKTVSCYHVVFPLIRVNNKGRLLEQVGTCFNISNGFMFMTAAHIFKACTQIKANIKKPEILREKIHVNEDDYRLAILYIKGLKESNIFEIIYIDQLLCLPEYDIGLLFVTEKQSINAIPRLPIIENPKLNKKVTHLGYPKGSLSIFRDAEKDKTKVFSTLNEEKGKITNLYETKRDNNLINFPSIETDTYIDSGYSGGPAICTETPGVLGVNSMSNDNYCISSWIGKILDIDLELSGINIEMNSGNKMKLDKFTLRDLNDINFISII